MQTYALDFKTLAIIEVLLMSIFEYKRYENIKKTGTVRPRPAMPSAALRVAQSCLWHALDATGKSVRSTVRQRVQGGFLGMSPFDPLGMASDAMAEREIKNGRLAMVAFIGFCSQAAVTVRPLQCLVP